MERRRAIAVSAATVAITLGAGAAVAANFGLLGRGPGSSTPLGQLDAGRPAAVTAPSASSQPAPNGPVRYEDIFVRVPADSPAATPTTAAGAAAAGGAPVAATVSPGSGDTAQAEDSEEHESSEHRSGKSDESRAEEEDD